MNDDADVLGIVEGCRGALERGIIELPLRRGDLPDELRKVTPVFVVVFDFTLGTHPISTKGTSEIGGAKRRSDFDFYTEPAWFFNPVFFSASFSL